MKLYFRKTNQVQRDALDYIYVATLCILFKSAPKNRNTYMSSNPSVLK